MPSFRRHTIVEQSLSYLRQSVTDGRFSGKLPGVRELAHELSVSVNTIQTALERLEFEGILTRSGRFYTTAREELVTKNNHRLRLGIFMNVPIEKTNEMVLTVVMEARWRLENAGHIWVESPKSFEELGENLTRLARQVNAMQVDAWILVRPTAPVVDWFLRQPKPILAYAGTSLAKPVSAVGVDIQAALRQTVRRLVELGHRRIVLLVHPTLRMTPAVLIGVFREELAVAGIRAGEFNTPYWNPTPEGLQNMLQSLFRLTPPSAIITDELSWLIGVKDFLKERGLRCPQDVSLVSICGGPMTTLMNPPMSHFEMNNLQMGTFIREWAEDVSNGRTAPVYRKSEAIPVFTDSIGPAPTDA